MPTQFLRIKPLKARIGKGTTTIYTDMGEGTFPRPIKIGAQTVAWIESEVEAIQQAYIRGATKDELRALVKELYALRNGGRDAA